MNNITGIITTLNEERNIKDCIVSLQQICKEIIVVDSGSTDKTREIATELGAKVHVQPYLGDGPQKNIGLKYASNLWVFSLDADERIMPELANVINGIDLSNTKYWGYAVRRRNYVGSRWMRTREWYPNYLVRLYRSDKLRFSESKQHDAVPKENTLRLKADIMHYRFKNIGELFDKPERNYSTRAAKIMYLKGKKVTAFTPFIHGFSAFWVNYLFRGGILYGVDGFTLSLATAYHAYLKYAKLLEYQRDPLVRERTNFEQIW